MNIVERIEAYLNHFMVFPDPDQSTACALWVLHTYRFSESFPERPLTTPYLYVHSAGPRSGKTQLIDLLEPLALNPERTINMTSAVMFRLIDSVHPTLFIDEVDTVFDGSKHSDEQNVINGGYKRSGYIWRTVPGPDGPEPTKFNTFGPKLLAGIDNGKLPDTVTTRCLPIRLERCAEVNENGELVAPDGTVREIAYQYAVEAMAEEVVEAIGEFTEDVKANYERYLPRPIAGLDPRAWEIIMPLIQVARDAGIEDEAREVFARLMAPKPEQDTPEIALLRAIREYFQTMGYDRAFSADLLATGGGGMTPKRFANMIRPFVEGSSTTITIGNRTLKGYYRHQFEGAWGRYL